MTPKEKARHLVDSYELALRPLFRINDYAEKYYHKQCAIISVDEIINTLNHDIRDLDVRGSVLLDLIKYWREVKEELEKL